MLKYIVVITNKLCIFHEIYLQLFFKSIIIISLQEQSWFLRDLIALIRGGKTNEKLQQDVVPSISVLDRLIGTYFYI